MYLKVPGIQNIPKDPRYPKGTQRFKVSKGTKGQGIQKVPKGPGFFWDRGLNQHTCRQKVRQINSMTWPCLGAKLSEKGTGFLTKYLECDVQVLIADLTKSGNNVLCCLYYNIYCG